MDIVHIILVIISLLFIVYLIHQKQNVQSQLIQKQNFEIELKQALHDIRSPLIALNIAVEDLEIVSEERRKVIRSSTNRINSIANKLLGLKNN